MALKHPGASTLADALTAAPLFTLESGTIPRHELPEGELPPDVAYQIVHDELMLDGNARMNVATFVSTWMEPQAEKLMAECFDKNMIDKDEYPQTAEIEMRCVNILANLWHAPPVEEAVGCSTTGSSEAAMLGGLALKRRWQKRRAALRERGWQVPAYTFPENRTDLAALRVVVRRGFTHDMADMLVAAIVRQLLRLERQSAPVHDETTGTAFAH